MKMPFTALAALLALAACSSQPTAGGLTADEERELDNAAAMLDQQNIFDTSAEGLAANEAEGAAQENGAGGNAANRSDNAQ
jgi:long-subunit fatty acid transport protein